MNAKMGEQQKEKYETDLAYLTTLFSHTSGSRLITVGCERLFLSRGSVA